MLGLLLLIAAADSGATSAFDELVSTAMAQTEKANAEAAQIAADMDKMLKDKGNERHMQDLLEDMKREQQRVGAVSIATSDGVVAAAQPYDPARNRRSKAANLREQRRWASSLARLCPPGSDRSGCLAKALETRLQELKATPTPQ